MLLAKLSRTMRLKTLNECSIVLWLTEELGDDSLLVHLYKQHFFALVSVDMMNMLAKSCIFTHPAGRATLLLI